MCCEYMLFNMCKTNDTQEKNNRQKNNTYVDYTTKYEQSKEKCVKKTSDQ